MKSLEHVAQEFEIWRSTRTKRTKIPTHLMGLIEPLYANYKKTEIMRALKIGHGQLKKLKSEDRDAPTTKPVQFLEFPGIATGTGAGLANCELRRADGATLKLNLPTHQLASVFQAFLCCN